MRLLHFALSTLGYGETLIGLGLADQLKDAGVESHFVVAPISQGIVKRSGHAHTVIDGSMGPLVRLLIDDVVDRFQPDAIVLSDYWTFCGVFERYFRLDPWFIDQYDVPIIPIDIWEWEKTDFVIDMCGKYEHDVSKRLLDMDVHLRPVPVAHLDDGPSGRAFPYRLWGTDEKVSRRTRGHLFTTFGLQPTDRLVLLAFAAWQQLPPESCRADVARLARAVPELLASYLARLPDSTHFLVVGQLPPSLSVLPAERTHVMPPCSMRRFSTLLGSADLVVSLNAGATTVARAALSDIPALVVTNRFTIEDADGLAAAEAAVGGIAPEVRSWLPTAAPLYPFRMWPIGFHSFLDPVFADNPYSDAVAQVELLDQEAVVAGMEGALYDAGVRAELAGRRAAYRRLVDRHPKTPEVFASAVRRLGLNL